MANRLNWKLERKFIFVLVFVIIGFNVPASPAVYSAPLAWAPASFQLPGGQVQYSSPTLADLDGNGQRSVLIGTTACAGDPCQYNQPTVLVVVNPNGTVRWSKDVGAPINSSPSVGDINGDGYPEIVVSVGGDASDMHHNGAVIAFDRLGNQLWRFATQDYAPVKDNYTDGVISSPVLCDMDGDGKLEIAFGGWDQRIYLLDYNGNSLWNNKPNNYPGPGYFNQDTIWSSPACGDLNNTGQKQIVIGADISPGGGLVDGTPNPGAGGFVYVFDKDGNVLARRYLPETVFSSPALGDLNGDGKLDIVTGTGDYWYLNGNSSQPYVYAFDTSHILDGSIGYSDPARLPNLPGWPQATDHPAFSSPALADLNGDGKLDVVIATENCQTSSGSIYAWSANGQALPGWPVVHPKNWQNKNSFIKPGPVIADIDNDGSLDVLFSMLWDVQVYGANGAYKYFLETKWSLFGTPAVGDTNNDGFNEVWIGGSKDTDSTHGYLWRFTSTSSGIGQTPWPMFHREPAHKGRAAIAPVLAILPGAINVMHQYGDTSSERVVISISNGGDGALYWTATTSGGVGMSPASGSAPSAPTITIPTAGKVIGTHNLGNIVVSSTAVGSTVNVPVTLRMVSSLFKVSLPVTLR